MEYLFWTGKVILSTGRGLLDQGFEYKPEGNKAYSLTIPRAFCRGSKKYSQKSGLAKNATSGSILAQALQTCSISILVP